MTYYKTLGDNGQACHGGTGWWALPCGTQPGAWMPRVESPVLCERGYHLCCREDLVRWLAPTIYEAEIAPEAMTIAGPTKVVTSGPVRLVRRLPGWNATTARRFAADCAEHVLPIWDAAYPTDDRPRAAIAAARASARGEIGAQALAAAWDAAWDAVSVAAWAAGWATASNATQAAARTAAWATASNATRASARTAVWAAAWAAAWAWQTDRLFDYLDGRAT